MLSGAQKTFLNSYREYFLAPDIVSGHPKPKDGCARSAAEMRGCVAGSAAPCTVQAAHLRQGSVALSFQI
jgi:hypothetical protein